MSETNKKDQDNLNEEGTENKKQPTQKGKKSEKTEKKENIFKRFGHWCGRHKEAIITGAVSFVGGVGTTVGAGIVLNKRAERRARQQNAVYIPDEPEQNYSPLDPNV